MLKLIAKASILCLAAGSAVAPIAPAIAQDEGDYMYARTYYDDAAMTIEVGHDRDTCNRWGIGSTRTIGRYGPYVSQEVIARCVNGELAPF